MAPLAPSGYAYVKQRRYFVLLMKRNVWEDYLEMVSILRLASSYLNHHHDVYKKLRKNYFKILYAWYVFRIVRGQ